MMGHCGSNALPVGIRFKVKGLGFFRALCALAVPICAEAVDRMFEPAHAGCHFLLGLVQLGSAPAPGAVFRALAENPEVVGLPDV